MHIRQDGETEDEFSQYMREYPIYKLVRKYSDYIRFPIKMLMPHPQVKEGSDPENPGTLKITLRLCCLSSINGAAKAEF